MHVVIVGNGVAGATCALETRKRSSSARITLIGGESPYFFSRTALMYALQGTLERRELEPHERSVWREQRITLVHDWMSDLDASQKIIRLKTGGELAYDKLVLALGAQPRRPAWPSLASAKHGVVRFVSLQDLDACEREMQSAKSAVVVGGGLIGLELVECLRYHGIATLFAVREPYYFPMALGAEEAALVEREMRGHGVDVRLREEITDVVVSDGRACGVVTKRGEALSTDLVGICIGVEPQTAQLANVTTPPALGRGVRVSETLATNLTDVWACGDCAETPHGVELLWYSAKRQGQLVAQNLVDTPSAYVPPIFYNSAKFFEVEYTTVGEVMALPAETPSILRSRPASSLMQRIVFDSGSRNVRGFNMLGSRWDAELLSTWVKEGRKVDWVLSHLSEAQLDPELSRAELSRMHEQELLLSRPEAA